MGVAFGMSRYAYGLTLPDVEAAFDLSEMLLGLIASATFVGYLGGLVCVPFLTARRGPRAPTTVGGVCGALGCSLVALAPNAGVLGAGAVLSGSAAGWVWAPYSDVARAVATPRHRPVLLAVITTGTGVGLIGLGALGLLAPLSSWRLTWAGIAVAAVVAAVVNLRTVPKLDPPERDETRSGLPLTALVVPLGYAVVYFAAITVYFTYSTDAAEDAGLPAWSPAVMFALIGIGGLVAFWTGSMTAAAGPANVAMTSLGVVGVALGMLALAGGSAPLVLGSSLLLGSGFLVGSSVLAIWTAHVAPDRPGAAFTLALVVGAVVSIATPAAAGAVIPATGLPAVLLLSGLATIACAGLLATRVPLRAVLARSRA